MGSLLSTAQLATVTRHVEDAMAQGATVLAGGRPRPDIGPLFYEPTVLEGVTPEMVCRDEETFGPVVSVYRVGSDDEAIALANDTAYGLNASVWTRDVARGRPIAARIKAGHRQRQRGVRRGVGQRRRADGRDEGLRPVPAARRRGHHEVHRGAERHGPARARPRCAVRPVPGGLGAEPDRLAEGA